MVSHRRWNKSGEDDSGKPHELPGICYFKGMLEKRWLYVLIVLLAAGLSGCENSGEIGLSDLRFIILATLFVIIALSVFGSYKNGGEK